MMKKSCLYFLLLGSVVVLSGFSGEQDRNMNIKPSLNDSIEAKIDSLLAIMTLEEKAGQMNQYNGFWEVTGPAPKAGDAALKYEHLRKGRVGSMLTVRGVDQVRAVQEIVVNESRLGIPLIIGFDVIHGYKTLSPIPLAEAASWDMEAIRRSAQVGAAEAAASGINWTFAPMVDVSRDARWGRVMEGGGEDPYLGSKIAAARVKGFQGDDLSDPLTVAATAKHFATLKTMFPKYHNHNVCISCCFNGCRKSTFICGIKFNFSKKRLFSHYQLSPLYKSEFITCVLLHAFKYRNCSIIF